MGNAVNQQRRRTQAVPREGRAARGLVLWPAAGWGRQLSRGAVLRAL